MTAAVVDTTVWSLFLRRTESQLSDAEQLLRMDLRERIARREALLVGPVYQEVLSGIRTDAQFDRIKRTLNSFGLIRITRVDFETGATFFNSCQRAGVQGAHTDFLVCAVAHRLDLPILTADDDFARYARVVPIRLHQQT